MSIDIAAELRSWCIDHHLPSGASECLFCEAAIDHPEMRPARHG